MSEDKIIYGTIGFAIGVIFSLAFVASIVWFYDSVEDSDKCHNDYEQK